MSEKPSDKNPGAQALEHGLSTEEYALIKQTLGREPNRVEAGILGAMWSEHCSYKSSKVHLSRFPTEGEAVIHGPGENAGVMDIGGGLCVVFKMESHNHPSFIEPREGAATGVGGILRDIFTMGARPVAILDSLRFGDPSLAKTRFLVDGVVSGIAGYGNCVGVPTVGGEVDFDGGYNGNPLVNVLAAGIARKDRIFTGRAAGVGNPVIYVGSKTGRDGIKGAVMASDVFGGESPADRPAVQIGDPFTEKLLIEACMELFETDAVVGIQDMGAAGLTSSSAEMAERSGNGIRIECEKIPRREEGMTPYEIMLSESQERMLVVIKKGKEDGARKVFEKWGLDFSVIGQVTEGSNLVVAENGGTVANLPVRLIADAPKYSRPLKKPASPPPPSSPLPEGGEKENFVRILSSPFCTSRHWIYGQYDYMVGAATVSPPGGSDAAVVRIRGTERGLALTSNCNSRYCLLNPREGAKAAVAESARNIACSGAKPLGITDCLNFGNPENPEVMWQFSEAVDGISEAAKYFSTPVVSGNVSLYNETAGVSINPTPVIGMAGIIDDVSKTVPKHFRDEGDVIFIAGRTFEEMGGSVFSALFHGEVAGEPPSVNLERELGLVLSLAECGSKGIIKSAHDVSTGGLGVALAECCFSGSCGPGFAPVGFAVRLDDACPGMGNGNAVLFSETQGRAVVTSSPENESRVASVFASHNVPFKKVGAVTGGGVMEFEGIFSAKIQEVIDLWLEGFEKSLIHRAA